MELFTNRQRDRKLMAAVSHPEKIRRRSLCGAAR
jgi:hypothetical protein